MDNNAKRGKIAPYQLFFIILVSRSVVALTFYQAILINGLSPDIIISALIAFTLNIFICVPSYFCTKSGKNPLDSAVLKWLYFTYFLFFSGVNISRFAYFASEKTFFGNGAVFFIILMASAACYAAYTGIESLGRFCFICAVISIILLIMISLLNVKNFRIENFIPFFVSDKNEILQNALIFASNSIEAPIFLLLYGRTNNPNAKPPFLGICASYASIIIMRLFCISVLGAASALFPYPVYTLFQMTSFKSFSRLDILYTAFGFFALFAKCAVLIYCAAGVTKKFTSKTKCLALFVISSVISLLIYHRFFDEIINGVRRFYLIISIIFCIALPLIFLILPKKRKEEKLESID